MSRSTGRSSAMRQVLTDGSLCLRRDFHGRASRILVFEGNRRQIMAQTLRDFLKQVENLPPDTLLCVAEVDEAFAAPTVTHANSTVLSSTLHSRFACLASECFFRSQPAVTRSTAQKGCIASSPDHFHKQTPGASCSVDALVTSSGNLNSG